MVLTDAKGAIRRRSEVRPSGCWAWVGRVDKHGYGRYFGHLAHRLSYESFRGPIPSGLELDHVCRFKLCVNPDHLEPVTRAENMRRRSEAQTHCKNGHEYTLENTHRDRLGRRCRHCWRDGSAAYRLRKSAQT